MRLTFFKVASFDYSKSVFIMSLGFDGVESIDGIEQKKIQNYRSIRLIDGIDWITKKKKTDSKSVGGLTRAMVIAPKKCGGDRPDRCYRNQKNVFVDRRDRCCRIKKNQR